MRLVPIARRNRRSRVNVLSPAAASAASSDFRIDVDDIIVDGEKVAVRMRMSGTHKGDFMGMPASGKRFSVAGIDVMRMVDGKALDHWGVMDTMAMMQQLSLEGAPA